VLNNLILSDLEQPLTGTEHEPPLIDCNHVDNFTALVKLALMSDLPSLEVEYFEDPEFLPQEKDPPNSQDFGDLPSCEGLSD